MGTKSITCRLEELMHQRLTEAQYRFSFDKIISKRLLKTDILCGVFILFDKLRKKKCHLPYADSIVENRFHAIEKLSEAGSDISCTHCDRAVLGYQREVPITMGA
jgi:hypothetical protein